MDTTRVTLRPPDMLSLLVSARSMHRVLPERNPQIWVFFILKTRRQSPAEFARPESRTCDLHVKLTLRALRVRFAAHVNPRVIRLSPVRNFTLPLCVASLDAQRGII